MPKLLMGCSNYWTSPLHVGSHQLARQWLMYGWEVGFISDPISPLHLAGGWHQALADRFRLWQGKGRWFLDHRLWAYVPNTILPPRRTPVLASRWLHDCWPKLTFPSLAKVIAQQGFANVDLIYLDNALHLSWLKSVTYQKLIYRVPDYQSAFASRAPHGAEMERELVQQADLVVYSAASLHEHVESMRPRRSAFLPNGVDYARFQNADLMPPPDLATLPRPIAIYVGAMHDWLDTSLLSEAARQLPEVSFVLIGPAPNKRPLWPRLPNLHWLGARRHEQIPAYLHHADVGLIPFNVKDHGALIHRVNPLKLYEYLACGLPVVATAWDELQRINAPAIMCHTPAEFVAGIKQALADPKRKATYRQFAARHDWKARANDLFRLIDQAA